MNDKAVSAENERLLALFEGVDENKVSFVREHVRQLAWFNVRIRELQKNIDKNGITIEFQNGRNQHGLQSNPDLRALIDLQKLTNAMIRTLLPLVPEKKVADPFAAFSVDDEPITEEEKEEEYNKMMEQLHRIEEGLKIDQEQ